MSAAEPDSLPTPTLDAESAALLQSISAHGGYAYARLASSDDPRAAEAAREMAWEQLHSAPWHSVLPVWRDAYCMSCLHVAKSHYRNREFKEALRVLDMGILMGGSLLRADLGSAVRIVSAKARENEETGLNGEEGRRLKKLVEETDFNKAEVVRLLPVRSLACKIVVKRSGLSLEGFLKEHFVPACPVVISDSMGHWPALSKWNDVDYLDKVAGDRTVPLQVGKNYLCQVWKQELITFSQFLERVRLHDSSSSVPTYLAQHQLFDQISELRKDVCIPDYCFVGGGELRSLNAWFGPCGTVTPLHHDPYHNILAQVVGKKYIRLYSASHSEELYPHSETMLCNSSKVDLDNIDETEFPKMLDLDFQDCILEEGEMLYIPPKWWHYVRSLTRSLSVSFWWSDSNPANS